MRIIREADVQALVGMPEALEAVERAFREQAQGTGINEPRRRVHQPAGVLHMMGGALTEWGYWGFKAYTATREGVRFLVNLYDSSSGALLSIMEANYLGQLRTGAASGVATQYLARPDADTLALFGTGFQAETQLTAIAAVRSLKAVRVYGRNAERRAAFASQLAQQTGLHVEPAASPQEALAGASIVATATSSREPVFAGRDLADGVHINAAGSNSVARSEVDSATLRRVQQVFTDDIEQARFESGDLIMAYERNALVWSRVRLLADVVGGHLPGRSDPQAITLFASHGIALWDIALAALVYERAQTTNAGEVVAFFE